MSSTPELFSRSVFSQRESQALHGRNSVIPVGQSLPRVPHHLSTCEWLTQQSLDDVRRLNGTVAKTP